MGRRARNPRRTTRAEPARNADARNPRVLLILLVLVVVVAVVVVVGEAGGQDGAKMHCIAWSWNKNYHAYMELLFGIYGRCFLAVGDIILWAYLNYDEILHEPPSSHRAPGSMNASLPRSPILAGTGREPARRCSELFPEYPWPVKRAQCPVKDWHNVAQWCTM